MVGGEVDKKIKTDGKKQKKIPTTPVESGSGL